MVVQRQEIADTLQQVIDKDYADAFKCSPELQRFKAATFPAGEFEGLWFYLTAKGKRHLDDP